jgi:DNA modification methylase
MNLGTATVLHANARHLPLADNTVDLVVTSPPYFALRSYQDGGEHYAGQIGDEPTPAEFVASLLEVTAECVRVLKPSGSLWVNLGDKYAPAEERSRNGNGNRVNSENMRAPVMGPTISLGRKDNGGVPRKSLIGIPSRYALACIDDLGLILRAEVIWSKPNGLPESVTDRVRRSHEQWFHFTLEPRYFSAVDEIRETYTESSLSRARYATIAGPEGGTNGKSNGTLRSAREPGTFNPLGKLPGSVWTIPTEPLRVPDHLGIDHFAAFPTEWPKRIIQGWSPAGVCVECGEGRRPVSGSDCMECGGFRPANSAKCPCCGHVREWKNGRKVAPVKGQSDFTTSGAAVPMKSRSEMTETKQYANGYACACPEPTADTRPAVVLDPFGGTGTTAMVAKALGRHGISVDMSADYCRLAEWRTNDRNQLAKVLGVAKVEAPPADQLDLFTEELA